MNPVFTLSKKLGSYQFNIRTIFLLAPFKFKQEVFNGKTKIDVKFENETVWL